MMMTGVSFEAKADMPPPGGEEDEMRWAEMWCEDGSGSRYEICFYTGDGNLCTTWGDTTRDCS